MEAFLWSIEFSTSFFAWLMSYVSQHRILGLFVLLGIISLYLGALTGTKEK